MIPRPLTRHSPQVGLAGIDSMPSVNELHPWAKKCWREQATSGIGAGVGVGVGVVFIVVFASGFVAVLSLLPFSPPPPPTLSYILLYVFGSPHGMVLSRRCILRVAGAPQDAFMPDCAGWQREALCIGPRRLLHNGRPAGHRMPHCCRHLPGLALTIPAACPNSYSFRYPPQVSAHRHSRTL